MSFLNALKSISSPLKNIKKIKPNVDRIFNISSLWTSPKNEFPIIIPINISATTTGKKVTFNRLTIIGVRNAATTTMTKEKNPISSPYVRYDINVVARPK